MEWTSLGSAAQALGLGLALLWIGLLGWLWRRSLLGMLLGLLFSWIAVAVSALALSARPPGEAAQGEGALFVVCAAIVGTLQVVVGLGLVMTRVRRRGRLDADDAGLLEG